MRIHESLGRDYGYERPGLYRKSSIPYVHRSGMLVGMRENELRQPEELTVVSVPQPSVIASSLKIEMDIAPTHFEPPKSLIDPSPKSVGSYPQSFDLLPQAKKMKETQVEVPISNLISPEPIADFVSTVAEESPAEYVPALYATGGGISRYMRELKLEIDSLSGDVARATENFSRHFQYLLTKHFR